MLPCIILLSSPLSGKQVKIVKTKIPDNHLSDPRRGIYSECMISLLHDCCAALAVAWLNKASPSVKMRNIYPDDQSNCKYSNNLSPTGEASFLVQFSGM